MIAEARRVAAERSAAASAATAAAGSDAPSQSPLTATSAVPAATASPAAASGAPLMLAPQIRFASPTWSRADSGAAVPAAAEAAPAGAAPQRGKLVARAVPKIGRKKASMGLFGVRPARVVGMTDGALQAAGPQQAVTSPAAPDAEASKAADTSAVLPVASDVGSQRVAEVSHSAAHTRALACPG